MDRNHNHRFVSRLNELDIRPEVIAATLDKSATSVYRWKSGEHMPRLTPEETAKFCTLLKVDIYQLAALFEPSQPSS